jgi:hypothetical protein
MIVGDGNDGQWKAKENGRTVSHPFHCPWKSRCDSHIPIAATTTITFQFGSHRQEYRT